MLALLGITFSFSTVYADDISSSDYTSDNISSPIHIVYALESELIYTGNETTNIYARPFLYKGSSYVPLRSTIDTFGGQVEYIPETNSVICVYNSRAFEATMDDPRLRVYDGTSFIKIRDLSNAFGLNINWYDGIITVSNYDFPVSDEDIQIYKSILGYSGHNDKYLSEIYYTVNPYEVYTYDQMKEDIYELYNMYPEIISQPYSIGQSVEGRDICAFNMGTGDTTVILCAAMHAREYIASIFLMYLCDRYAYAYAKGEEFDGYDIRAALDSTTFIVIPMMNPDGTNLVQFGYDATQNPEYVASLPITEWGYPYEWSSWKANINGVDLNKNYPVNWLENGSPRSSGYAGPSEGSEPETQAMLNLVDNTDFQILASFHSQGKVIYWMDDICDSDLRAKFSPYVSRICYETGFESAEPGSSKVSSGFLTDYVRYTKRDMALTIELCDFIGNYPYPESDFDSVSEGIRKIGAILADVAQDLRWEE